MLYRLLLVSFTHTKKWLIGYLFEVIHNIQWFWSDSEFESMYKLNLVCFEIYKVKPIFIGHLNIREKVSWHVFDPSLQVSLTLSPLDVILRSLPWSEGVLLSVSLEDRFTVILVLEINTQKLFEILLCSNIIHVYIYSRLTKNLTFYGDHQSALFNYPIWQLLGTERSCCGYIYMTNKLAGPNWCACRTISRCIV